MLASSGDSAGPTYPSIRGQCCCPRSSPLPFLPRQRAALKISLLPEKDRSRLQARDSSSSLPDLRARWVGSGVGPKEKGAGSERLGGALWWGWGLGRWGPRWRKLSLLGWRLLGHLERLMV